MENLFKEEIIALVPKYVESKGNCTLLYIKDSDPIVLDKAIKTVIRLIGKSYMIDLNEMKKRYSPLLPSKNLMPIPLSRNDILIALKTRIPMYKNDGAFSYINMKYIKGIKKDNRGTIISLDDGIEINCLCGLNTVNKHLRNGKIISRCYEERSTKVKESESYYNTLIPATKADIELLHRKLEEIIRKPPELY